MKTTNQKMKSGLLFVAILMATATIAQPRQAPQNGGEKGDKIEAMRVAFITQQLNLTPEEAQKFWPVYNQYHEDIKTLRRNFKTAEGQELSADQQLDFEQKKLDLKKRYKAQFEGVIGKEKVNSLYGLEDDFRKKMQEERQRRQQNGGAPHGNR